MFIEDAFERWSRAIDLPGKLRTMRLARAESGEAFALLVSNPGIVSPVSLDLKLIEADQVCTPLLRRGLSYSKTSAFQERRFQGRTGDLSTGNAPICEGWRKVAECTTLLVVLQLS